GQYVGRAIRLRLRGESCAPFRYKDRGMLATIGRASAIADFGFLKLSGFAAWVVWLFVHLMQLVSFQNRVLVLIQWAWIYITFDRSACLISRSETDSPPVHHGDTEPSPNADDVVQSSQPHK